MKVPDTFEDLKKQGFMRMVNRQPKQPKQAKPAKKIVACNKCHDWHVEGKHTRGQRQ